MPCSQQELMEQLDGAVQELHSTSERLRSVEAQRLAAVRDAEHQRSHAAQLETRCSELDAALRLR
jgi:hypothetical protein